MGVLFSAPHEAVLHPELCTTGTDSRIETTAYAKLSEAVYRLNDDARANAAGWTFRWAPERNDPNGYNATVYQTANGDLVMAYAGTDNDLGIVRDMAANFGQGIIASSDQYTFALEDYRMAQRLYPGRTIHSVGHSLGGGLASYVALRTGTKATTFNGAGVHPFMRKGLQDESRITAYRMQGDFLSTLQDTGSLFALAPNGVGESRYLAPTDKSLNFMDRHGIGLMITEMEHLRDN